jgi:hypothetical protein
MVWMTKVQFLAGARKGFSLFTTMSRAATGPTHPPIHLIPGTLSPEIKWPWHEADHLPPSSALVTDTWSYTSTPQKHLHGMVLI